MKYGNILNAKTNELSFYKMRINKCLLDFESKSVSLKINKKNG